MASRGVTCARLMIGVVSAQRLIKAVPHRTSISLRTALVGIGSAPLIAVLDHEGRCAGEEPEMATATRTWPAYEDIEHVFGHVSSCVRCGGDRQVEVRAADRLGRCAMHKRNEDDPGDTRGTGRVVCVGGATSPPP